MFTNKRVSSAESQLEILQKMELEHEMKKLLAMIGALVKGGLGIAIVAIGFSQTAYAGFTQN